MGFENLGTICLQERSVKNERRRFLEHLPSSVTERDADHISSDPGEEADGPAKLRSPTMMTTAAKVGV